MTATVPDRSATPADAPEEAFDSTTRARTENLISPRFYTTDFEAMDQLDLEPVRQQWDALLAEFDADGNKNHFKRDASFDDEIQELSPELMRDFVDFMITSVTSEYSGHVLYADIKDKVDNPDIKKVMAYMARDEARHAGFINRALRDFDLGVNLSFLRKNKDYTFFKPKYVFYATYLSEKIGYARYITIFRHLQQHPQHRFHPMFRWFEQWCNDEFRHGEVFALIMRADPKLLSGPNQLWIRFFLLAVYCTMYVRDHTRPALYAALGMDITDYDLRVLHITNEITRQIFPFTLNLDDPRMRRGLDRLTRIGQASERAKERGGLVGAVKRAGLAVAGAATFARLYLLPVNRHVLPDDVRLKPAW